VNINELKYPFGEGATIIVDTVYVFRSENTVTEEIVKAYSLSNHYTMTFIVTEDSATYFPYLVIFSNEKHNLMEGNIVSVTGVLHWKNWGEKGQIPYLLAEKIEVAKS